MTVKLINWSGDNLLEEVAYIARVSNPASQEAGENSERLIKYLIRHKHWSPFEMVSVCMEIETTRDIARQILRHRSFSFQEFSQRYAEVEEPPIFKDGRLHEEWRVKQENVFWAADTAYKWALLNGLAKEQARAVLPEGITPSRLYMNGTLRSWIHYIELRSGNGTQKEHADIAVECANALEPLFPMIMEFVDGRD